MSEVRFTKSEINGCRIITLSRGSKLNVLNLNMFELIQKEVISWAKDSKSRFILLQGEGKAFCAGGDVKSLATTNEVDFHAKFFQAEYSLDFFLYSYSLPIIALWDGITMGGGVGLSMAATYRVVTEKTMFAMPECAIGLFPDVAASYFLNQIEIHGEKRYDIGLFIALTGERLYAADCLLCGFATDFVPSETIDIFRQMLLTDNIENAISQYATSVPQESMVLTPETLTIIQTCFSNTVASVEEIMRLLTQHNCLQWLEKMKKSSPTSLKLTFELMRRGQQYSISQAFDMDYRLALRCMNHSDFKTGVMALLIDKTNTPVDWLPATLDKVTSIETYFQ